jgi:hypothetical protein
MGKSQNTFQLAAGMNGKLGMGVATPILAFSLEDALQLTAGFFTKIGPMGFVTPQSTLPRRRVNQ